MKELRLMKRQNNGLAQLITSKTFCQ